MSLPVPNLDDRRFQDLVDEAKRLIPRFCPEWTNHNLSDPGIALVELFAWMTEMVLYRVNQVPDAYYTRFLNLMGVEPYPPAAARTDLMFWLTGADRFPGDRARRNPGGHGRRERGPGLLHARRPGDDPAPAPLGEGVDQRRGLRRRLGRPELRPDDGVGVRVRRRLSPTTRCTSDSPARWPARCCGSTSTPTSRASAWIRPGHRWCGRSMPTRPGLPMEVVRDLTGGLNRWGEIVLMVPPVHEPLSLGGTRAFWLRVRLTEPRARPADLPGVAARSGRWRCPPSAAALPPSTASWSTASRWARATAARASRSRCATFPVLPRRRGEVVRLVVDGVDQDWTEVADFAESGPDDRHVVWDSTTGEIRFGPTIRYPDGSHRQHGAVPAAGAEVGVSSYRHGGGSAGNVGARTLVELRSAIPFVAEVANPRAGERRRRCRERRERQAARSGHGAHRRAGRDRRRLRAARPRRGHQPRPGARPACPPQRRPGAAAARTVQSTATTRSCPSTTSSCPTTCSTGWAPISTLAGWSAPPSSWRRRTTRGSASPH